MDALRTGATKSRLSNVSELSLWNAETPLFVGRALAALVSEEGLRLLPRMNGRVVIASEVAELLNVRDENNLRPISLRSLRLLLMASILFFRRFPSYCLVPRRMYAPWVIVRGFAKAKTFWN